MRLIKVASPKAQVAEVIELAFKSGIPKVSTSTAETQHADGKIEEKINIDIATSTPKAKQFINALLAADFYDPNSFTINTRQPRSVISSDESLRELTVPIIDPATDIVEELWQFSQITISFIGRFFIGGCLLAYGLINQQMLVMVAGLLFLPFLPLLLAISFGSLSKQKRLVWQGMKASLTAIILLFLAGMLIAAVSDAPVKYAEFNSPAVNFLISLAVGTAAVLANTDDVGRRELIGLAATSQLAILPVWFGVCSILGFPATLGRHDIILLAYTFPLNIATITLVSLSVYFLLGASSSKLKI